MSNYRNNPLSIYVRDYSWSPSNDYRVTMTKTLSALIVVAAVALPLVLAAQGDDIADRYFSKTNPKLNAQERGALAIAKRWKQDRRPASSRWRGRAAPSSSTARAAAEHRLRGAPGVAALQAGEQVNSINLGDTARWTVELKLSPAGPD